MSKYILPVLILILLIVATIRRVNIYESFVLGARESLKLVLGIFPYLAAMMLIIELFTASGLDSLIIKGVAPIFELVGIPKELAPLIIIRPLSGNGSIAMLESIIAKYGVDSYIARTASVIVGASETIFYVATLYFSTTKVKKLRYAIPVALIASFVGVIVACLLTKIM